MHLKRNSTLDVFYSGIKFQLGNRVKKALGTLRKWREQKCRAKFLPSFIIMAISHNYYRAKNNYDADKKSTHAEISSLQIGLFLAAGKSPHNYFTKAPSHKIVHIFIAEDICWGKKIEKKVTFLQADFC